LTEIYVVYEYVQPTITSAPIFVLTEERRIKLHTAVTSFRCRRYRSGGIF